MKKCFIVFMLQDGMLVPHTHPVFAGDIAYDLQGMEQIQVCPELDVREFVNPGEAHQAMADYLREHKDESNPLEAPGHYFIVERFTIGSVAKPMAASKSRVKSKDATKESKEEKGKSKK